MVISFSKNINLLVNFYWFLKFVDKFSFIYGAWVIFIWIKIFFQFYLITFIKKKLIFIDIFHLFYFRKFSFNVFYFFSGFFSNPYKGYLVFFPRYFQYRVKFFFFSRKKSLFLKLKKYRRGSFFKFTKFFRNFKSIKRVFFIYIIIYFFSKVSFFGFKKYIQFRKKFDFKFFLHTVLVRLCSDALHTFWIYWFFKKFIYKKVILQFLYFSFRFLKSIRRWLMKKVYKNLIKLSSAYRNFDFLNIDNQNNRTFSFNIKSLIYRFLKKFKYNRSWFNYRYKDFMFFRKKINFFSKKHDTYRYFYVVNKNFRGYFSSVVLSKLFFERFSLLKNYSVLKRIIKNNTALFFNNPFSSFFVNHNKLNLKKISDYGLFRSLNFFKDSIFFVAFLFRFLKFFVVKNKIYLYNSTEGFSFESLNGFFLPLHSFKTIDKLSKKAFQFGVFVPFLPVFFCRFKKSKKSRQFVSFLFQFVLKNNQKFSKTYVTYLYFFSKKYSLCLFFKFIYLFFFKIFFSFGAFLPVRLARLKYCNFFSTKFLNKSLWVYFLNFFKSSKSIILKNNINQLFFFFLKLQLLNRFFSLHINFLVLSLTKINFLWKPLYYFFQKSFFLKFIFFLKKKNKFFKKFNNRFQKSFFLKLNNFIYSRTLYKKKSSILLHNNRSLYRYKFFKGFTHKCCNFSFFFKNLFFYKKKFLKIFSKKFLRQGFYLKHLLFTRRTLKRKKQRRLKRYKRRFVKKLFFSFLNSFNKPLVFFFRSQFLFFFFGVKSAFLCSFVYRTKLAYIHKFFNVYKVFRLFPDFYKYKKNKRATKKLKLNNKIPLILLFNKKFKKRILLNNKRIINKFLFVNNLKFINNKFLFNSFFNIPVRLNKMMSIKRQKYRKFSYFSSSNLLNNKIFYYSDLNVNSFLYFYKN